MTNKFKGNAEECLDHWAKEMPPTRTKQAPIYRKGMVKFVGVSDGSVLYWRNQKTMPDGINQIRLWYYLESIGYEVDEISAMSELVYQLGFILAHRIATPEDARVEIGYGRVEAMYRVIREGGTEESYLARMQVFIEKHCKEIERIKKQMIKGVASPIQSKPANLTIDKSVVASGADGTTKALVHLSLSLAELAEQLLNGTELQRQIFRELLGQDEAGRIGSLLLYLSNETATKQYLKKQTKKE